MLGRTILEVRPDTWMESQAIAIMERLRAGESWSGELLVRRRDGSSFPSLVTYTPIHDDAGRLVGIIGISTDITARKRGEEAQRLLARVGAELVASLDLETHINRLVEAVVPAVADWALVHTVQVDGEPRLSRVVCPDPERACILSELRVSSASDPFWERDPLVMALRSGEAQLVATVADDWPETSGAARENASRLRALGVRSFIALPLVARGRTIGALTLGRGADTPSHDGADFALGQELARLVALFLDNARLYRNAREAVQLRDLALATVSHDPKDPIATILGIA